MVLSLHLHFDTLKQLLQTLKTSDMNTNLVTMRENLTKLDAKEIYYYKWTSDEPYTVVASDGKKYGNAITIGYTDDTTSLHKLGLPVYNHCPFN